MIRVIIVILLTVGTAACGFHLKDSRSLPDAMSVIYLEFVRGYQAEDPLILERLRQSLTNRGAVLVQRPQQGGMRIRLYQPTTFQRVQSVGADSKAIEYESVMSVDYEIFTDAMNSGRQTVHTRREYTFDEDRILEREDKRTRVEQAMQKELAELLILRIEAFVKREG